MPLFHFLDYISSFSLTKYQEKRRYWDEAEIHGQSHRTLPDSFANTAEDARDIGFDDNAFYRELQMPRAKRQIPSHQLLRDQALAVFREWQEKVDRIEY